MSIPPLISAFCHYTALNETRAAHYEIKPGTGLLTPQSQEEEKRSD